MIIDVTGFGWSGSGAVHDLLREYDDVKFAAYDYDWEFTLLWDVDGIYDLEHKLCHKHCRCGDSSVAIKRFLRLTEAQARTPFLHYDKLFGGRYFDICKQFIDSLVQFSYQGRTFEEVMFPDNKERLLCIYNTTVKKVLGNHIVLNYLKKDLSRPLIHEKKHQISVSYNPVQFLERTQLFLSELFSIVRGSSDLPLVTDQFFPPDCPELFFKYLNEDAKCIIVRRDPRDTYLLAKRAYKSEIPLPVDNVENFIAFYKKTISETRIADTNKIMSIQFEDLIYKYDETKDRIEDFLCIKKHSRKKAFFNPLVSINNTQLYHIYCDSSDDVKQIEKALPGDLYDFERFNIIGQNRNLVF